MDSKETLTPPVLRNKSVKSPLLTPCRRLGLARNTPGSSSSWHASKLSHKSPFSPTPASPLQKGHEGNCDVHTVTTSNVVQNEETPKRCSIGLANKRSSFKKLKTCHFSSLGDSDLKGSVVSSLSNVQLPEIHSVQFHEEIKDIDNVNKVSYDFNLLVDNISTKQAIQEVKTRVERKEELLKDVKLTHLYKKKHDVNSLQMLTKQWREGCQIALQELLSLLKMQGHILNMEELLNQLHIPSSLVQYNIDNDDFD